MFAVAAAICFLMVLLKVALGTVDLLVLGWLFIACHLIFGSIISIPTYRRGDRQPV
jgi:hypothetical protein